MKAMSKKSYTVECFKMNEERSGSVNHFERCEGSEKLMI